MEETELLRKLLAQQKEMFSQLERMGSQQDAILSRVEALESGADKEHATERKDRSGVRPDASVLTPELRQRLERCIDTARYIPKIDLARELLRDLYDIERSLTGEENAEARKEVMQVHTGLLNMLASVGVDTADLPLELTTQESVLARVDRDLAKFDRQVSNCQDPPRAESLVDDLRSIADTLTVNRKRFHIVEEVDRRLGRIIGLMSRLSSTFDLRMVYMPPRTHRPHQPRKRKHEKRTYIETPNVRIMTKLLDTIDKDIKEHDPALKPSLLARLDEAEEDLFPFDIEERGRFEKKIAVLRNRVARIKGKDPLEALEETVESLEGTDGTSLS